LLGIAGGALALLWLLSLSRPLQTVICAVSLLGAVMILLLTPDLWQAPAVLSRFDWPLSHLMNFNVTTRAVSIVWPIAACFCLLALAGRADWGATEPAGDHV